MTQTFADLGAVMRRALELASGGVGSVEPNPPVGAVLVDDSLKLIAEGFHRRFGGPHAEIVALEQAGEKARGATLAVSLEPCCHHGKTGPCVEAVIASGVRRVVAAMTDPSPQASGKGIERLRGAGVDVETGLLGEDARRLVAPFCMLVENGRPWVHAKWAMSLDGKTATRSGASKWISSEDSRRVVHELRGRMDAIIVGIGTVLSDDPLLTARPPGPRVACRIVLDSSARLALGSQLVRTAGLAPVILATSETAAAARTGPLEEAGVEVLRLTASGADGRPDLGELLNETGRRGMTNVLVEGGAEVAGSLFDAGLLDEVHVFVAPRILGGRDAVTAIGGRGLASVPAVSQLENVEFQTLSGDQYIHGLICRD